MKISSCWQLLAIMAGPVSVPPTSQNQKTIEADLTSVVDANLRLDNDNLTHLCEQAIRNYDPCISCATHFLRLEIDRG